MHKLNYVQVKCNLKNNGKEERTVTGEQNIRPSFAAYLREKKAERVTLTLSTKESYNYL